MRLGLHIKLQESMGELVEYHQLCLSFLELVQFLSQPTAVVVEGIATAHK